MFSQKHIARALVTAAILGLAAPSLSAEQAKSSASADLKTFQQDGGQTFFAMSLAPPAAASSAQPRDVVILFDTSASQTGEYRAVGLAAVEACIAKLGPQDRVQLLAVDLDARAMHEQFAPAGSKEVAAALQALRRETPLGATDMELALQGVVTRFAKSRPEGRAVLYIGDGRSAANLLGTEAFGSLVRTLADARIPVSSYAIGPECDARLLAALANQTGGNLYVAEPLAMADESQKVSAERAHEENMRRGADVGASLADWVRDDVIWPAEVSWPAELGEVYPKTMPPLRTDRDTVVIGAASAPLDMPVTIELRATGPVGDVINLEWTAKPQPAGSGLAFLTQAVDLARRDGGVTLPTVGSAGLAETGRLLENNVDGLTELAERAVATGDLAAAVVASHAVLQRDPGNVQAKTVQRIVERKRAEAPRVAQAPAAAEGDLNLVRPTPPAPLPVPPPPIAVGDPAADEGFPAPGSLTDQFAPEGALLDRVEEQRRVYAQMMRREIENTVIDARRKMNADPDGAIQDLKLALQTVERAPELNPDVRAQLTDKLQTALREAQRAASIKDELDAAREEELAAARERRMINERIARNIEREKQLMERFNALVDEGNFDEALDVAAVVEEVDPDGVVPRVATVWSRLQRNHYIMEVARAARWQNFFDTLYQVELSSIPFPDDPPIVYPDSQWWKEMSVRRKERYGSMDLASQEESEIKIERALNMQLTAPLEYVDQPLGEVVSDLREQYGIPIKLDDTVIEEAGLSSDEPVSITLDGVSLRSALRLMLKDLQLTYVIQDEVLLITTPEEAETQLVVKVYPVADLVLPIDSTSLSGGLGGGGGIGGQGGGGGFGGGGGGQGGGGGFGGGGGGFGGGGQGGGGGFFSVPNDADEKASPPKLKSAAATRSASAAAKPIAFDKSANPEEFWHAYFQREAAEPAAVRATVRELMGKKQYDQVIAMVYAALRHGQPQPWMYESLGIAMELAGRSKPEIERAVMSAADFSTSSDELMYIAQYLSRLSLDRRAMQLYQQVVKLEPLRGEAYALGLRAAQRCENLAGIQWATIGILSQAWPEDQAPVQLTASRVAKATLAQLESDGRNSEREQYLRELQEAVIWDCVAQVSWTGNADVDISVEEPAGTVCSLAEPRSAGGGVCIGDGFAAGGKSGDVFQETYACPKGFAGTYRLKIERVWGEVTAGKVTVDVYKHLRSGDVQHERRQIELGEKDALVAFDLEKGRRTEPLEAAQLAGAVKRQEAISRAVLAQQLSSGSDDSVLPVRPLDLLARRAAFLRGAGAVGFQPIIQTLPEGTMFAVTGVVSADRRYVRITAAPLFSTIGDVQTFTFAGSAEEVDEEEEMPEEGEVVIPPLNQGGGGFGGR